MICFFCNAKIYCKKHHSIYLPVASRKRKHIRRYNTSKYHLHWSLKMLRIQFDYQGDLTVYKSPALFRLRWCSYCIKLPSRVNQTTCAVQTFYCIVGGVHSLRTVGLFQITDIRPVIRKNKHLIPDTTDVMYFEKLLTSPPFTKWSGLINFSLFYKSPKAHKTERHICTQPKKASNSCVNNHNSKC